MSVLISARSPGKLILSGEHAVVYGKPALAMATHYYTQSSATIKAPSTFGRIGFQLSNLRYAGRLTRTTLTRLKERIKQDYHGFLQGELGIREVLKKPFELIQFTVANVMDLSLSLGQSLDRGLDVRSHSTIPIGCGMGSSAALIMSTLKVVAQALHLNLNQDDFLRLGKEAENAQHGYSSGLDLHLCWQGGMIRFENGQVSTRVLPLSPLYLVNTGQPASTTGECVAKVRSHFDNGMKAEAFAAVTTHLDRALQQSDTLGIHRAVKENHQLLKAIGVVPERVVDFIEQIEAVNGVAKTCGAGAIYGNQAGMVLVLGEDVEALKRVAMKFGYSFELVQGDESGTVLL